MRGETYHVAFGIEGIYPGVQLLKNLVRDPVLSYCIKNLKEISVFLSVDFLEFYCDVIQFLECLGVEEIWGRIDLRHVLALVFLHHRRQLVSVPDHQQLDSSERLAAAAVMPQAHVYGVEQVRPDHGNLVDYQQIKSPDDLQSFLAEPAISFRHLVLCDEFLDIRKIWT